MTFEEALNKITKAWGGYMSPKEQQAMETGWWLSRAEALKEAAEVANEHRRRFTTDLTNFPPQSDEFLTGKISACGAIGSAIEAKAKEGPG